MKKSLMIPAFLIAFGVARAQEGDSAKPAAPAAPALTSIPGLRLLFVEVSPSAISCPPWEIWIRVRSSVPPKPKPIQFRFVWLP